MQFAQLESEIINNLEIDDKGNYYDYLANSSIYHSDLNVNYEKLDQKNPVISQYQTSDVSQDKYAVGLTKITIWFRIIQLVVIMLKSIPMLLWKITNMIKCFLLLS